MSSIKTALSELTKCEYDSLMVAFDAHTPMFIELKNGYFVGVHIGHLPNLNVIEQSEGGFFYGRIE